MKKLFFTLLASIIFISIYGQAPQEINYQGVARNSSGTLLSNQNIGIKLDLHQGSAAGTVVFSETHNKTTNVFGLFTLGIGSVNTSAFIAINWANGPYFLEVSMDPAGGTSYSSVGTQQFMSVPYALYAKTAGNASATPTITINAPNTVTSSAGSYTINVPAAISYSAGTGIDITGGVISNTASATTPTIVGTGATTVTGTYPNLTINTPTVAADQTVSLIGTGNATVTGAYPNFTVNVPNSSSLPNALNGQFLYHTGTIWDTLPRNNLYFDGTNFGIGTTSPQANFHLVGAGRFDASVSTPQIYTNNIKITGGIAGQVLTSDAIGNGTWQAPAVNTPTINSGGVANVTNTSTNVYLVDVPAPSLNYNSGTKELTLTQNGATSTATLIGTGSNTVSIVGSGLASVTPTTGSTFTVSVPNPTLSIASGSLSISNGNSVAIPSPSLSINSNSLTINGPGGNTVLLPTASTTSLTPGTNITVAGSSPSYTVSAPAYSISLPGGNTVQITNGVSTSTAAINATSLTLTGVNNNILSAGGNTVALNTYTAGNGITISGTAPNYTLASPNQSLSITGNSLSISGANTVTIPTSTVNGLGTGIATVTTSVNNFTVNVPSPTYTASTGILSFGGTNTVIVTPSLSLSGTTLTSGASTNSVNLSSLSVWSNSVGVLYPTTLTNSVGIGTSGPITGKFEISHSATAANPHLNFVSPSAVYGRIKYSNSGQTNYFSTEYINDGSGNNEAFSINQFNGTNSKPVLLINGQRMTYVNALNYPLATFHVMTSTATASGGIASEGFAQSGQLNIVRNNNAGAGARSAVILNDEIGKINFAGFDGAAFGDGAKIYAKAAENVTGSNKGTELIFAAVPTGTNTNKDVFKINGANKLEVITSLLIPFNSGTGKVLTSDGAGNASWQVLTAPAAAWTSTLGATTLVNTTDKIGIGTNTPFTIIHAKSDISFPYMLLETAVNHGGYISAHSGGTLAAPTYNTMDVILGGYGLGGYDVTNFGPSANMSARTSESWNSTSRGTALYFETTQNGQTGMTPRMKIDHNGYVGINSNAVSTFIPQSILHVETDGSLDKGLRVSNSGSTTNGPSIYLDGQNQDWTITGANAGNGSGANKFVIRDYSNAADRFVIDNTGKVGVGLTVPGEILDVNGNVQIPAVNEYKYASAKTKYLNIPSNALHSMSSSYGITLGTYVGGYDGESGYAYIANGVSSSSIAVATAPVYLPDGAIVTELFVRYFDQDATYDGVFSLERKGISTINNQSMASFTTTGSSSGPASAVSQSIITISNSTIDNANFAYYFKFKTYQLNTNIAILDIRIKYTVLKAD